MDNHLMKLANHALLIVDFVLKIQALPQLPVNVFNVLLLIILIQLLLLALIHAVPINTLVQTQLVNNALPLV